MCLISCRQSTLEDMTKKSPAPTTPSSPTSSTSSDYGVIPAAAAAAADDGASSVKNEKKKKSIIPKIFSKKNSKASDDDTSETEFDKKLEERRRAFVELSPVMRKSLSERQQSTQIEGLNLSTFDLSTMATSSKFHDYRMFVGTWNVGGRTPTNNLSLENFLQAGGYSDIYVLGFQEIVPLNAGNVLVVEDNEPAAKWLAIINQALNHPRCNLDSNDSPDSSHSGSSSSLRDNKESKSNFFQKPALKVLSKNLRVDSSLLKTCNCSLDTSPDVDRIKRHPKRYHEPYYSFNCGRSNNNLDCDFYSVPKLPPTTSPPATPCSNMCYRLIASKQMVGIFLSVWARNNLIPYIAHLRVCTIGRGIMGCLGNKGCISISMTLHRTSFCFVCSHLASGQKEGDELKRNADVAEILKSTQFSKLSKKSCRQAPEKIDEHDRIFWLGDLNYRLTLSYEETKTLLEEKNWSSLLKRDQLNIEREAGRVFKEWREGRIGFAPTYKYKQNSDSYAGETKSKKKRRTPAWCDRILWSGDGIGQLCYTRGESKFSDHRPVCSVFSVEVEVRTKCSKFRKGFSCAGPRREYEDVLMPHRHTFYDY